MIPYLSPVIPMTIRTIVPSGGVSARGPYTAHYIPTPDERRKQPYVETADLREPILHLSDLRLIPVTGNKQWRLSK